MKKYFLPIILLLILFDRSFVRSQSLVFPLIVHDAGSGIDTLRFGYKDWATYCIDPAYGESELDPQPPWYVFDARFIDSRSHVCLGQGLSLNLHEFDYFPGNDTFLVRFS